MHMAISTTALDPGRHVYVIILFSCFINCCTYQIIYANIRAINTGIEFMCWLSDDNQWWF